MGSIRDGVGLTFASLFLLAVGGWLMFQMGKGCEQIVDMHMPGGATFERKVKVGGELYSSVREVPAKISERFETDNIVTALSQAKDEARVRITREKITDRFALAEETDYWQDGDFPALRGTNIVTYIGKYRVRKPDHGITYYSPGEFLCSDTTPVDLELVYQQAIIRGVDYPNFTFQLPGDSTIKNGSSGLHVKLGEGVWIRTEEGGSKYILEGKLPEFEVGLKSPPTTRYALTTD